MKRLLLIPALVLLVLLSLGARKWKYAETPAEKARRMRWWQEARFGMFIHWGTYSLSGRSEWVKYYEKIPEEEYTKYFRHFYPDLYDPARWARLAREAGMRYAVITAKHHEGFCLWDSKYTDYKATNTPYGRDLLRPFVKAFREAGLRVGFYYSLLDWHHPQYTLDKYHPLFRNPNQAREENRHRNMKAYVEYMKNQLRELLTQFGRVDLLFLDFSFPGKNGKGRQDWHSTELLSLIRSLQPWIIINDRLDLLDFPGGWDYRTPEQVMPRGWVKHGGHRVPWETCQTITGYWGYMRDSNGWKSTRQLITMLIEAVSKGGNLLLNVGPTGRGAFPEKTVRRLKGIGRWMRYHSRSIYGCTQPPDEFKKPDNCLLTYNPQTRRLYIHVLSWPSIGRLHLEGYGGKVEYAQLLHDASEVKFTEEKGDVILHLPIRKPAVAVPVIEVFLK